MTAEEHQRQSKKTRAKQKNKGEGNKQDI